MNKRDYYFKPRKKERSLSRVLRIIIRIMDAIMWTGGIVITLLLIMAMLARYINPAGIGWLFAFVALIFPILFVSEIVVALYWIVRWKWMAIAVGGFVLFCLPDARLFYKPDFGKHYETETPSGQGVVVMSYNVMAFGNGDWSKVNTTASEVAEYINERQVDILCIQEFRIKENFTSQHFDKKLTNLKYHYETSYSNPNGTDGIGIAIYSRYPIIESGIIDTESEVRRSIWCDMRIHNDTIRVFSNHLQNTNLTTSDENFVEQGDFDDIRATSGRVKNIVSRLKESYRLRAPQAEHIAKAISSSPYPVIVCGDFNDTPLSYAYHHISKGLKDSYAAKGKGAKGTYHGFFNMFRIDYILYSKQLTATRFEVSDALFSDHSPIIAEMVVNK